MYQQAENRVTVNASDSLCAANAHSFQEQAENHLSLIHRQAHIAQRLRMIFGEGLAALIAAKAL
jgi:hypothetical protein